MPEGERDAAGAWWWLAAALAAGAAVRFYGLGSVFPVDDEYFQLFTALAPKTLLDFCRMLRHNPHHVLLDPLQTFAAAGLGSSLPVLRLPAALWGTAAVLGVWRLAREGGLDRSRAGLAAWLAALCLLHVDWSRRADFYALLAAVPAFQAAALLRLGRDPGRWREYSAWNVLFLYAHPYAVLSAPLHLTALRSSPQRLAWLKSWAVAGALFLPWFLFSAQALLDHRLFDFRDVPGQLSAWQFLARAPLFLGHAPEVGPGRVWSLSAGGCLSAAYLGFFLVSALRPGPRAALPRLWRLAVPFGIGAAALLDVRYRYYFQPRQALWILPFYLLGVADGLVWSVERLGLPKRAPAFAAALLAAVWLPFYLRTTDVQRGMLRGHEAMIAQVALQARPGDTFGFRLDNLLMAFLYHYDRAAFASVRGLSLSGGRHGHLGYDVPEGLRARHGGADNEVRLIATGEPPTPAPGLWRFEGSLYDLTVEPPPGVDLTGAPLQRGSEASRTTRARKPAVKTFVDTQ